MRTAFVIVLVGVLFAPSAHAKKPKPAPAPTQGWVPVGSGQCWVPPDFSTLAEGPKRVAWNETRDAIVQQWRGEKGDGIKLRDQAVEDLETAMLAKADRVETVSRENLDHCKAAMQGGLDTSAWEAWLVEIAGRLTAGECPYPPLDYTAFNYLNINAGWQNRLPVCKGDKVLVKGTGADYFQLEPGGPWINVTGDPSKKVGPNHPCNIEGCVVGQLVMKFTSDSHVEQVIPIGLATEFRVPEHGQIEVMINDDNLSDNKYKIENRLEHHTGIEVKPAED